MFVRESTYNELKEAFDDAVLKYEILIDKWNNLVERINRKGGEKFLNSEPAQFTPGEIKTLIKLCHPDKHGGSEDAKDITVKLLKMR